MNRRRATTLAELVICMSIGSSIMLLAIKVTHQALTASSQTRQRGDIDRASLRLAHQFRSDVHRAVNLTVDTPTTLRVEHSDETVVTYQAAGGRVTRERRLADDQSELEEYALGEGNELAFRLINEPERVEMLVRSAGELKVHSMNARLHVVAVVGKLVTAEHAGEMPDE